MLSGISVNLCLSQMCHILNYTTALDSGTNTSSLVINVKGNQMCFVHSKRMEITKSDVFELVIKARGYIISFHSSQAYISNSFQSKRSGCLVGLRNTEALYYLYIRYIFENEWQPQKQTRFSTFHFVTMEILYLHPAI